MITNKAQMYKKYKMVVVVAVKSFLPIWPFSYKTVIRGNKPKASKRDNEEKTFLSNSKQQPFKHFL